MDASFSLTDRCSRRGFLRDSLHTLTAYCLLGTLASRPLLAEPLASELDLWVRRLDTLCKDLKRHALGPAEWQERIESLLRRVDLDDLLAHIDSEALEKGLRYPDLGVDTARVRFPGFEPFPKGLSFHCKIFGMEEDRAIIPHGHTGMASSHLVLGGSFHLRQFDRLEDEPEAVIVTPTVDERIGPGHASSISDERDNVHWLVARGGRAHTLDVVVLGLAGAEGSYGIDNLDPERAQGLAGGRLRMPKLSVQEGLRRYGKDHHA